jgi:adenylate cyclase
VFRDKIVVIGSNAAGLLDLKATPFTHISLYPGMEIHATAIENMLTNDFIRFTPRWILVAVMSAIAFLLFIIDRIFHSLRLFIGSFFMLALLELVAAYFFLTAIGRWIPVVDILSATMFVFAGLVISGYFHETKEKRLLKRSFGRYVNETVLNEILSNPQAVDFRGRTIRATIMATDIEGFTGISEKLLPHEVVKRLNDYLSEVSGTLIDNDAYINKYIGDAILALFGAFGEPGHERTSCMAAVKVRDIVQRKIEEAKLSGEAPMVTRFGIATGEMTMGNIGSELKLEFTVIGDTVNTAFRFEGLNKFYRTTIIVGDQTMIAAGDIFEFRQLDIIRVKGKETPEVVYELLGLKGDIPPEKLTICSEFERAGELYRERRFEEALEIYSRLAKEGDGPSEVFEGRCRQFMTEPPQPEWDGVWVMLRK